MVIDGEARHFILSTSDIFREGKSIGAVLVFHDISNRKALEEELRLANRSMSTLNQIIRHDMRNDLTAIGGYLELLEATEMTDRQRQLVGKVIERARSAEGHLDFAKMQQTPGTSATTWHDVQSTIEKALDQVDMKGIKVESQPARGQAAGRSAAPERLPHPGGQHRAPRGKGHQGRGPRGEHHDRAVHNLGG